MNYKIALIIAGFILSACGAINYSVNGTLPARLLVADSGNNRILIWNSFPTSTQQPADIVLGQPDMASTAVNAGLGGGVAAAQTLNGAFSATIDGNRLIVADRLNHRVLIWNTFPITTYQAADIVLGQSSMTANGINAGLGAGAASSQSLYLPFATLVYQGRLFVSDLDNNRILIWNTIPTSNQQPADLVLGHSNMTSNGINDGGGAGSPTSRTLYRPLGILISNGRFFVADYYNSRVLIWNSVPTASNQPADLVLGQPGMTTSTANNGGITAQSLFRPGAVASDGTRLFVADTFNNRVLIWNSLPTTNQQPADFVLGQPTMNVNAANAGDAASAQTLNSPQTLFHDGSRLYVTDYLNHRVLMWSSPTITFQAADLVLGQSSMAGSAINGGGAANSQTMQNPATAFSSVGLSGVWRPGGY